MNTRKHNSRPDRVQVELPDPQGRLVSVIIDQQAAKHLLNTFQQVFTWSAICDISSQKIDSATLNDADFVATVLQAASTVGQSGRLDEHHVFINQAWKACQQQGYQMDLTTFKQRLSTVHEQGRLQLGCAALMQTLNASDIVKSEIINIEGEIVHFIRL